MPGIRFSELCLRFSGKRIYNCKIPRIDFRIKLDIEILNKSLLRKDYYSSKILKIERAQIHKYMYICIYALLLSSEFYKIRLSEEMSTIYLQMHLVLTRLTVVFLTGSIHRLNRALGPNSHLWSPTIVSFSNASTISTCPQTICYGSPCRFCPRPNRLHIRLNCNSGYNRWITGRAFAPVSTSLIGFCRNPMNILGCLECDWHERTDGKNKIRDLIPCIRVLVTSWSREFHFIDVLMVAFRR